METNVVENGRVEVPRDYFLRMAKMDYNDYREALAREFYQNSVDASATVINVHFDNEERSITVTDNGIGMDYDVIKNKLLVLGGSEKRTGDVGAFGKAKEVLYFSWQRYEVRTRNLLVTGKGAEYTIQRVGDWHDGTTSKIWMWRVEEDFVSFKHSFRQVAQRFQVYTSIKIDDVVVDGLLKKGTFVKDLGWAEVYCDSKKTGSWRFQVRIQGQWMFSEYHGEDDIGEVVLELKSDSADCLTSNRDALKAEYKKQFSLWIKEVLLDRKSALEAKNPTIRKKYKGTGKVEVNLERFMAEVKKQLDRITGGSTTIQEGQREEIFDALLDIIPAENMNTSRMDRIQAELSRDDFNFDLTRIAFIGYEPDFVVVHELKDKASTEKFMGTKKAKVLAKAWTEILKQVLLDIEWYGAFTAGFNFEQKKAAAYEKIGDDYYFYLNPTKMLEEVDASFRKIRYDALVVRTMLREDLLQKAIHEISHLQCGYHNDGFTSRCELVRARTWKSFDIYPKLLKEAFED